MWLYGHRDVRYRVLAARCVSGINGHPKCKNIMQFRLQMLHTSRLGGVWRCLFCLLAFL